MTAVKGFAAFLLLACLVSALPCSADRNQNWIEVRSPHFTVLSNAGEKDGRHAAAQFENIRAVFHAVFPKLRVDAGKPTIIFALRNEDSLKIFIPNYGLNSKVTKLAGLYSGHTDMNFALVRTDVSGSAENEYHSLYHEYTHSILHMNFRGLPLWLDEGLAEFYGNTKFYGKEAAIGLVERNQLAWLQRESLIPVGTLVSVDFSSPLYNGREHNGIFYAESWALVHYFMFSEDVKKLGLLDKFLAALQASDDPVEAAQQSFGDLKKLADKLNSYARQQTFTAGRVKVESGLEEKDFAARPLPPAEALTQEANFLLRSGHANDALSLLHEAEEADAKVAALHDAMGYYHFLRLDYENAAKEYDQALALNPNDSTAYYYKAEIAYRKNGYKPDSIPQIRSNLEKAVALDPNFAPAHAFLCIAYTQTDETKLKSIAEANAAVGLEPGNLAYYIDLGRAALANGKSDSAKKISERAQKAAMTPRDRAIAASFAKRVASNGAAVTSEDDLPAPVQTTASEQANQAAAEATTAEGQITELICGKPPEVLLTLATDKEQMLLHVADIAKIAIVVAGSASTSSATPCAQWKDRRAKVKFEIASQGAAHGEIQSIEFF